MTAPIVATGRRTLLQGLGMAAIGLSFSGLAACRHRPGVLNFYTWDTYIGDHTLADFRKASGIEVKASYYASNEELFARLRDGNPGYDVIIPSNDLVARMAAASMLVPLNHAQIPHFRNIAQDFRNPPYDPGCVHSMPYTWLVTGIGYRKSKVEGVPDSWKWLLDSDRYKGRIALLGDAADMFRIGARYLGHSVNDTDPALVGRVQEMLIRQKPNVAAFHDDNGQDMLLAGDVDLVIEYNGDIAQVMAQDKDLAFVVPREGSIRNADALAIPVGAPNPDLAHRFINFLLDGPVGRDIYMKIRYPTPNAAALALMPESYRTNPVIFPPADVLKNCEYATYPGHERMKAYEEAMTRVKAS